MCTSMEEIKNNPDKPSKDLTSTTLENLKNISDNKLKLDELRKTLSNLLVYVQHDPSFLDKTIDYLKTVELPSQIAGGGVFGLPSLGGYLFQLAGFQVNPIVMAVLGTGGIVGAACYIAIITTINKHNDSNNENIHSKLNSGVITLSELLGNMIESLNKMLETLTYQLNDIKIDHLRLQETVTNLKSQVLTLNGEIDQLKTQRIEFENQITVLEEQVNTLGNNVELHKSLMEEKAKELQEIRVERSKNELITLEKIQQLSLTNEKLTIELNQAENNTFLLQEVISTLIQTTENEQATQEVFQEQMNAILQKGERRLEDLNEKINHVNHKFSEIIEELQSTQKKYEIIVQAKENDLLLNRKVKPSTFLDLCGIFVKTSMPQIHSYTERLTKAIP